MGCLFAPLARTGTRPLSLEVGHAGSHADQYAGGHHRRRDPLRMPVAPERLAAPAQALESLQDSRRRLRCPAGHATEVWCFALVYYLMARSGEWGTLIGSFDGSFMDCVYFSFTTYTTIGFGDISPVGKLKYLTGLQALTGLVLISWTVSFLFLEMQKYWKHK